MYILIYLLIVCREELIGMYKKMISEHPIVSIEDPFFEDDWDAFAGFVKESQCLVRLY